MNKKGQSSIAFIGTAGVPCRYGGFETLAHQLVEHLGEEYNLHVYCAANLYPEKEDRGPWKNAKRFFLPFKANGWQSIIYDVLSIFHAALFYDVLMVFGVPGAIALPFVRLFTRKKIVVHIDGLEWKRGKWSKWAKKYLKWSEKVALRSSHAHIADNPALERYTASEYGKKAWMIPYGGDQTYPVRFLQEDQLTYPFLGQAYVFSVCRIEPENNISLILKAFAELPSRKLIMVGNWKASEYGKNLLEEYKAYHNIRMLPPIYDPEKLNLLRSNCLVYVHGHSAGGTNPSLVEAMSLRLPVLCFNVDFNRETTFEKAFYFKDAPELVQLLKSLKLTDFHSCASEMKQLADAHYTWKRVCGMYANGWDELLRTAPLPQTMTSLSQ